MELEKNDVDISKIFKWGRVFILKGDNESDEEGTLIYMKLLGDADVNRARVYALRKSAELRRKLRDQNSDERLAAIRDIEDLSQEDLINYILIFSTREITVNAAKEVKVPVPKMPKSNAKLEKVEKYQEELDAYNGKRKAAVDKYVQKEIEKLVNGLKAESKETLYKRYESLLIEEFCEQAAFKAYEDMQIYLGCFKDDEYKELFFSSLEEYDNLLSEQKALIRQAYSTLNIGMDDLKKLREVTP